MLSVGLLAALLWAYSAHANTLTQQRHEDVAGATLLVAPALLAIFVLRPGEHLLVTRMLGGVRTIVLFASALSVLAAGALIGLRPFDGGIGHNWHNEAVVATLLGGLLALSWLLTLASVETLRKMARRRWLEYAPYAITAYVVLLLDALAVRLTPLRTAPHKAAVPAVLLLGVLSIVSGWVALFGDDTRARRYSRWLGYCLAAAAALLLFGFLLLLRYDLGHAHWKDWRSYVELGLWACVGVALLGEVARQLDLLSLRPEDDPEAQLEIDDSDDGYGAADEF
jgi:hypothetical protein